MSTTANKWAAAGLRAQASDCVRIACKRRSRAKNLSPEYQRMSEIVARANEAAAVLFENTARELER